MKLDSCLLRSRKNSHQRGMGLSIGLGDELHRRVSGGDPIEGRATKVERKARAVERARQDFAAWRSTL